MTIAPEQVWGEGADWFGSEWPMLSSAGETPTITFPSTGLRSRAWIALGADRTQSYLSWSWTDITQWVRWDDGIEIQDGRRDQSDRVDASIAQLTVDNRDGRFSRFNPLGPWYGLLTRWTPIWLALDPGDGFHDRYFGFVNTWPKRWDRSATDATVSLTCRGRLHLLQRAQPLRSPMFYSISGAAEGDYVPLVYIPCEDLLDSERAASGLPNGTAATVIGDVTFAADEDLPGSDPLPFLAEGAQISVSVPAYTNQNQWVVQVALRIDSEPSADTTFLEVETPGGDNTLWRLYIEPGTPALIWWIGYNGAGVGTGTGSGISLSGGGPSDPTEDDFFGTWWFFTLTSYLDPDDGLVYGGISATDDGVFTGSSAGASVSTVHAAATVMRIYGGNGCAVGHWALFTDPAFGLVSDAFANAAAMNGWDGEMAHERAIRLCREQRIPLLCNATRSAILGPQPRGKLIDILRDTEKAGLDVLHEHEFGLGYQTIDERYNLPVTFTVDNALGQIADDLEPDDSDLRFRNQWTARRRDGSSATVQARNGIAGVTLDTTEALYEAEDTFSVRSDSQLPHLAGWLGHRDSLEEDYWPNVAINLAAHPELITGWLAQGFGTRMQVLNLMETAGISTIDAIREGRTEAWNSREWSAQINTSPAETFLVGTAGDDETPGSWLQTSEDTHLSEELTDGATTAIVWSEGPLFSTVEDLDFTPLSVVTGGEVMPVSALTSALADAFDAAVVSGWDVADTGQIWTVSGSGSASVSGGFGRQELTAGQTVLCSAGVSLSDVDLVLEGTDISATPAGDNVEVGARLRVSNGGNNYVQVRTFRQPGGTVTINLNEVTNGSQTGTTGFPTVSGVTSTDSIDIRVQPDGNVLRARAWLNGGTEPTTWQVELTTSHVTAAGDITIRGMLGASWSGASPLTVLYDGVEVANPQSFTVTRTLPKTHLAGSQLQVHRPAFAVY